MAAAARNMLSRLTPKTSALFLCDMQDKFRATVHKFPEIVAVSKRLFDAAKILEMPVIVTEQYPKGLGNTVPELGVTDQKVFEKTCFSMILPAVDEKLKTLDAKSIILCGIETHACIYQTTLDLLDRGYDVHLVVDASSSRSMVDRMYAFRQLEKMGAMLTTCECVLLALLRDAKHPKFRDVQKLIMEVSPDSDLLSSKI